MLSLEEAAATKVAIEICNKSHLKREILCVPGSDYDINKRDENNIHHLQRQWNEIVKLNAGRILDNLGLSKQLQEKVIGIVLSVGKRTLSWAKYHERTIGISSNYSFNFLNSSFFTTRGIVDCTKATEELMNDTSLSIKQKCKVALYCMNEHISAMYKQLTEEDKDEFNDSEYANMIQQPDFVNFWSHYLKDEVDKLRLDTGRNLYWLQMAVKSGNKDAVEYCLEETHLIRDETALIYAALEAVRNYTKGIDDICFVFNDHWQYVDLIEPWVPNHYYIDVVCFIFSKMRQNTQIEFLKEDIKGIGYDEDPVYEPPDRSRVLEFFLEWPYRDYFLKTVRLMWDFLPEKSYVDLIHRFCFKINDSMLHYNYNGEISYDYRVLLWEFLKEIPQSKRKYFFTDYEFESEDGGIEIRNACNVLVSHLIRQRNYTYQDKIIIEWTLNNASNEEKANIISSREGMVTCANLMILERWKLLDEFVSNCYISKKRVQKFKKELILKGDYKVCIDFMASSNWNAVESFIKWSDLSDVEIYELKEKMILTEYGRDICLKLISPDKKLTAVDEVIRWCFSSEDKVSAFKTELCVCSKGMQKCVDLVTADQVEIANEFVKWSISCEEEIRQCKKNVANEIGRTVCERLISDIKVKHIAHDHGIDHMMEFNGGNWEEVEKFLTWCFSSEDEINDFKKLITTKDTDGTRNCLIRMHLNLMLATKWEEAEILFAWLGLSVEEIRELKKETIFSGTCMERIDISLHNSDLGNIFLCAGDKWEEMELFMRWCLEDKDGVYEFRNECDERFGFERYENLGEDIPDNVKNNLNQFHLLIKELLNEL